MVRISGLAKLFHFLKNQFMEPKVTITKLEDAVITVTVSRQFRWRMWLALRLISLGVRISGAELKINRE